MKKVHISSLTNGQTNYALWNLASQFYDPNLHGNISDLTKLKLIQIIIEGYNSFYTKYTYNKDIGDWCAYVIENDFKGPKFYSRDRDQAIAKAILAKFNHGYVLSISDEEL